MDILIRNGVIALVIVIMVMIIFAIKTKLRPSIWHIIGILLFTMSMSVIFDLTGVSPMSGFHIKIRLDEISFIPFAGIIDMVTETFALATTQNMPFMDGFFYLGRNIIGNIVLFAPLGFFLPLLWEKFQNAKKTILTGFFISLLIECSQLFLSRGTDIDDLILNTLGTAFGFVCFIIFKKVFSKWHTQFIIEHRANRMLWTRMSVVCMLIPYVVAVTCGFYDRIQLILH